MEDFRQIKVPKIKLGGQGLEVSRLGFGCGGLSGIYNAPLTHEEGILMIKQAFNNGITFFDTSDLYGDEYDNEIMIGKALKELPREKIQVATKFGCFKIGDEFGVKGTPNFVRKSCEGSLKRLGVDYIDLYYQHRVDTSVPIEETVGELKKLVEEGRTKYIGLSEASVDTIRRAHNVYPLTAVQIQFNLWCRDVEQDVIPLCRELGIGIVAYSPLGRGFFGGKAVVEGLQTQSILRQVFHNRLADLSTKHSCCVPQLALAWLLHQGNDIVPIPGTTKIKNLYTNIESLTIKLETNDLKEILDAIPIEEVKGEQDFDALMKISYKFANTPMKKFI